MRTRRLVGGCRAGHRLSSCARSRTLRGRRLPARRAGRRGAHRAHRLAQRCSSRCWPPQWWRCCSRRSRRSRDGRVRRGHGAADAVRRPEPLLGDHDGWYTPTTCRPAWRCCSPRAPARVGAGVADRLRAADPGRDLASGRRRIRHPPDPQPDARDATGEGRRALWCGTAARCWGCSGCRNGPGCASPSVEERLFSGLAAQAGLVLRLVGLRAELEGRHAELVARADELKASRQRLIATQDVERRRLERDIHDGAQQHLVALAVNLRLAQTVAARSPERAGRVLAEQADAARRRDRDPVLPLPGDLPEAAVRRRPGSGAAVRGGEQRDPGRDRCLELRPAPAPVEAALYFCCMEAVQNAPSTRGPRT